METLTGMTGFLLEEKAPIMPIGKVIAKGTPFKLLSVLKNGNFSVKVLDGDLIGQICIMSSACRITLE